MADDNAIELLKRGDKRFSARSSLDTFRQEIALMFAPDLACWTTELQLGEDFAAHLIDGTPLIIADEYVSMIGSMLRPAGKQYFWHRTGFDDLNNIPRVREYLDWRSTQMMRITFDRVTGAEGALSEADRFYGLFGDGVLSVDYANEKRDTLRVQSFHTKDCTWAIGKENKADTITRKETVPARNIKARFSQKHDKLHEKVTEACEKDGEQTFDLRHEVLPASEYDAYVKKGDLRRRDGYVSVWIDATNKTVIRETHHTTFRYVIPRAGRRYGYPYGISRATMIALPDGRLMQQQAVAILEAAEKQVNPPLVAYAEAIRGDMSLAANKITWIDRKWSPTHSGQDPVTPLELAKNFQLGVDSLLRTEAQIARAFKLDRLRFPDTRNTKTREEAQFLIDEFVRAAVPMFSPMKTEYSDEFLFEVDTLIEQAGGYASREKPQELKDVEMSFQWDNPLTDMLERQKAGKVAEIAQMGQAVAGLEMAAAQAPALKQTDTAKMWRESVISLGGAAWILDESATEEAISAGEEANAMQGAIAAAPNVAQIIDSGVNAAQVASEIPNPAEPGIPLLPMPV